MASGLKPAGRAAAARAKLGRIGAHGADVTRFALDRALAHHDKPDEFPLPPAPCQERAFAAATAGLPGGALRRLGRDAVKRLRAAPAQRRAVLGGAAELDPKSPLSAVDQARARPVPSTLRVTQADLAALAADAPTAPAAVAPTPITAARLVAKSIRCIEDSLEPGRDEIVLGGFFKVAGFDLAKGQLNSAIDAPENALLAVSELGKFKAPQTTALNDLQLLRLTFLPTTQFPVMPLALVFLGEKDLFGFGLKMSALSEGFDIELIAPLYASYNISLALSSLSMIGLFTAASLVIRAAWLVGITAAAFALLRLLGDELFNAGDAALLIDSAAFRFPGGGTLGEEIVLTYRRRRAHYELTVQWQLDVQDA